MQEGKEYQDPKKKELLHRKLDLLTLSEELSESHLIKVWLLLSGEKCMTGQMDDGEKPLSFFFLFRARVRLFRFLSGGRSGLIADRSCPQAQIGNDRGFSPPTFFPSHIFRQTVNRRTKRQEANAEHEFERKMPPIGQYT